MQYSEEALIFLVETFATKVYERSLRGFVLEGYYVAEMYLTGRTEVNRRDCPCQYRNLSNYVNGLWELEKDSVYFQYNQLKNPTTDETSPAIETTTAKRGRKSTK